MNTVFFLLMTASIIALLIISPDKVLSSMINGASTAFTLSVTMLAIYCVWLSLLAIMEKIGINKKIDKAMRPLTNKLFKGESEKAKELISMNMSANLLGMGGAATPLGIRAVENMAKGKDGKATDNMIMFAVINCTSLQLLPTTIIGLRVAGGSINAGDIILPSLIATAISTMIGVILCLAFRSKDVPAPLGKNEAIAQEYNMEINQKNSQNTSKIGITSQKSIVASKCKSVKHINYFKKKRRSTNGKKDGLL